MRYCEDEDSVKMRLLLKWESCENAFIAKMGSCENACMLRKELRFKIEV